MELKKFLSNKYSTHDFEDFIRERFYGLEIQDSSYTNDDLSDNEKLSISEYRYLGKSELDDGKEIGFFEFCSLKSNIENKRVCYNTILKRLAKEYIFDGAIASFSHANSDVWRLSFVGLNYEEGKAEPTNLKRYTYVLGEGVSGKTAYEQLKDLKYPSFNEIEEAFAVEKVSKEFFTKYKKLYFDTLEELRPQVAIFGSEQELELFTKKLMGRITFLYFLQKKGWLGASKDWEDGNKRFLTHCLEGKYQKYDNFYEDILKEIFFEALNTDRSQDGDRFSSFGKMPYLNGGLFSKQDIDNDNRLHIENDIFKNIITTFDEYNFTIIEDTPHESEVAIDPEMLGKVFEDLLEDRKEKGAFYTPREIVHYMCQTSLTNYLKTKPKDENDLDYIKKIKILDPAIGSGAFPMGMLHEILEKRLSLGDTQNISSMKREIIENAIYGIDIEPSAVEIAKLRFWLSIVVDEVEPSPLPNLLYKIRVGNSLVEQVYDFNPLETKLYGTKGLIDKLPKKINTFFKTYNKKEKDELEKSIEKDIDKLFLNGLEKFQKENDLFSSNQKLHDKLVMIAKIVREYKENRASTEIFLYQVYFADIMDSGGFDIVIGNPPYVRHEKIKELKPKLKIEGYKSYNGTADLYIYFFEQGYRLLKENGILSYITSNKYTRAKYGKEFRKFVLENTNIVNYIDFTGVKVFESATVDTSILSYKKSNFKESRFLYCAITEKYKKENQLEKFISQNGFEYQQSDLSVDSFSFANKKELAIKKQIEKIGMPLKEWDINIYRGIQTGNNNAFIIDKEKYIELSKDNSNIYEIVKPIYEGKDISKYHANDRGKYLIYVNDETNIDKYPSVYKHLLKHKENLDKKVEVKEKKMLWYSLYRPAKRHINEFQKEKIIWAEMTNKNSFVWDNNQFYTNHTCYIITNANKYILSVLNSNISNFYIHKIASNLGAGAIRWIRQYVEQLPIPQISKEAQKPFEILVDYVIFAKENDLNLEASLFESVIDGMVYDLYFEDEMKKGDCFIFDEVREIVKAFDSTKIDEVYKMFKTNKTIQRGLIYRRVISVVKVINGGGK